VGVWCIPFEFLDEGAGVCAGGMGGTGIAWNGDIGAMWRNPAGVYSSTFYGVGVMYQDLMGYSGFWGVSGIAPVGDRMVMGLGVMRFSMEEIPVFPVFQLDEDSLPPEALGYFSEEEWVFQVSLGFPLPGLPVNGGFALRGYYQTMLGYSGTGMGFDVGVFAEDSLFGGIMGLGLKGENVAKASIWWNTESDMVSVLPMGVFFGAKFSYGWKAFQFTGVVDGGYRREFTVRGGAMCEWKEILGICAGYNELGASVGIFLAMRDIRLGYSLSRRELGVVHRLEIEWIKGRRDGDKRGYF